MQKHIKNKIIVEGLWDVGKTTLCEYLNYTYNYEFVKEPDHLKQRIDGGQNLDDWYIQAHIDSVSKANKTFQYFCMERSLASTLAFIEARDGQIPSSILKSNSIKEAAIYYQKTSLCVYLQASPENYRSIRQIRKDGRIESFLSNDFTLKYIQSFEKWLQYFFDTKLITLPLFKENGSRESEIETQNKLASLL
jgi:hypothetical protein